MNVVNLNELRGQTTALASIVRVGDFNQQFGNYHSLNLLPGKRAVIDAYNVSRQKDLIQELRANGYELILDTKGAELLAHSNGLDKRAKRNGLKMEFNEPWPQTASMKTWLQRLLN